ncbi:motility protein A [Alkalimarinus alittae]|uniref:MotA/TolQ/ExbB proton channel family protein n=1 Tax=Alkalimarinus alittae TaxID=2961619 RepID=A0ABY6N279_9ALTE|nr:MotA/TolQ/ExbB proton channel family protein [Alkalimarinus alittae]UZE96122.1 MotA/TolQ/ExbB proton channel family protein [Alkalimarinus alittae]
MDIATLIGLLTGSSIVILAITAGSSLWDFINLPGLGIVIGGTMGATFIKFRISSVLKSIGLAFRTTFLERTEDPLALIQQVRELASVVRKDGILGLESFEVENAFLKKSINLCVDGHPAEFVEEVLTQEVEQSIERYDVAEKVFRGIAETAPGLGMLGTLIGLVQMLNNMEDPSTIGPAMAVALLTTFYGAFIAQMMAIPLADKLENKAMDEHRNMSLIITSIQSILKGQNPRVLSEVLTAYVHPSQRDLVTKQD